LIALSKFADHGSSSITDFQEIKREVAMDPTSQQLNFNFNFFFNHFTSRGNLAATLEMVIKTLF